MSDTENRRDDDRLYIPVSVLPELLEGTKIKFFYRANYNEAMREIVGQFPKKAAEEFCTSIKRALSRGQQYYCITGGDVNAHKEVLQWILDACNSPEGTKLRFRELQGSEGPFEYYPEIMKSAEKLGIKGFAGGIQKRMMAYARKNLIDPKHMYEYYDLDVRMEAKLKLREVVVESVFNAWYDSKKEGRWNKAVDEEVGEMRYQYPAFDEALDARLEKQKEEREAYLRKKREEREGTALGDPGNGAEGATAGAGWDQDRGGNDAAATGGWDASPDASTPASGGWDSNAEAAPTPESSWADEAQAAHDFKSKW